MLLRLASVLAYFFSSATAVIPDVVGGTGCTVGFCVLANARLRFGNGNENSVNAWGLFQQPWYFSPSGSQWYKLTFNNYPLDTAIGTGTGGPNWSGTTVVDLYSQTASNAITDYSNFVVDTSDGLKTVGHGKIVATRTFTILGQQVTVENTFSLGLNDSFVKIITRVTNIGAVTVQNMMVWVGTRDDFVGTTDVNTKTRGNLNTGSFVAVTSNNQSSRAIMITNTNEGVLFYSETAGVMTSYALCCSFSNAYNTNPLSLAPMTTTPTDGSYAAVLPIGTIASGASSAITWYYAAGVVNSLAAVAQSVAVAQAADATPSTTPTMTPTQTLSDTSTPSETQTQTLSDTSSVSGTVTPTQTLTGTVTHTGTVTLTSTPTGTVTLTGTRTLTGTLSGTSTISGTLTSTQTPSRTSTQTQTPSQTSSQTPSRTLTSSPTAAPTPSADKSPVAPLIVNIYDQKAPYDPLIYLYIFLPINIVMAISCCICLAVLIFRKRKNPKDKEPAPQLTLREAWAPSTEP